MADGEFTFGSRLRSDDREDDRLFPDADQDGIPDRGEVVLGTDPHDHDSDGDGLFDGTELSWGTNPLDVDTDNDSLTDFDEMHLHHTDPRNADSDRDGLDDIFELGIGTDPARADTDRDGDSDYQEVMRRTNPTDARHSSAGFFGPGTAAEAERIEGARTSRFFVDSDGDGVSNGAEAFLGLDAPVFPGVDGAPHETAPSSDSSASTTVDSHVPMERSRPEVWTVDSEGDTGSGSFDLLDSQTRELLRGEPEEDSFELEG